jgi:hypothetical protein
MMYRNLIYTLKRRNPTEVTIVRLTSSTLNTETGRKTIVKTGWLLNRAVKLPYKQWGVATAGTPPVFSGTGKSDVQEMYLLVDLNDLPSGFAFRTDDYFQIHGKRYNIKNIEEHWNLRDFVLLTLNAITGDKTDLVHVCSVLSNLNLESTNNES